MQRDRTQRLERDLALAHGGVDPQAGSATKTSPEPIQPKQAAESGAAELKKALQQERERAERLERDLATARRDVETQTALAAKASDESTQLKQAAESGTAELQKSLQQERERAERLERDLATARREVETQTALAAKAGDESTQLKQAAESGTAELQKSLQQERDRAERLEQDLSTARTKMHAYEAQASKASDEQAQHDQAEGVERDLASARRDGETQPALAAKASAVGEEAQDKRFNAYAKPNADRVTVADTRGGPQPNPEGAADVAKLMALASVLLGRGDIGAARIVLERAVETGSAQASFTLAETYDPLILPKWGTYGTRGDTAKARDFYARAETGGIKEAKERSEALRR
jgi:hypothetical protein